MSKKLSSGYRTPKTGSTHPSPACPDTPLPRTSWAPETPSGAYAGLPCWRSREQWLKALSRALCTDAGRRHLATKKLGRATVLRVAACDASYAEVATGRELRTAHETVAQTLDLSRDTVKRARWVITRLGFMHTVLEGRYLTTAERAQARAVHGCTQLRIASTRALTVPHEHADATASTPLVRRTKVLRPSHLGKYSPTRAQSAPEGAASRQAKTRRAPGLPETSHRARHLGRRLLEELRGTFHQCTRPAELARVLDATPGALELTPRQLIDALSARNVALGQDALTRIHNPAGWLRRALPVALAVRETSAAPASARPRSDWNPEAQRAHAQHARASRESPAGRAEVEAAKAQIRALREQRQRGNMVTSNSSDRVTTTEETT